MSSTVLKGPPPPDMEPAPKRARPSSPALPTAEMEQAAQTMHVDQAEVSTVGLVADGAHVTSEGIKMVPTVYPSWDEFIDFNHFLKRLEAEGAAEHGLVKVVPPPDWPWFKDPNIWYTAAENDTPAKLARKLCVRLPAACTTARPTCNHPQQLTQKHR